LSIRNNEDRFSAQQPDLDTPTAATQETNPNSDPLSFVVPTELVELPSRGEFYPTEHPLHGQETIEIKYMTAKEEDILTSQSLLEKGLAFERLMANLIVNKRIKPEALLSGDRNAILIAARKSGYGADYITNITCPSCGEAGTHDFNLDEATTTYSLNEEELVEADIQINVKNNFVVTLPNNPVTVEFRMLTGKEENFLLKQAERRKKKKQAESAVTDQLKLMIVSVNEYTEPDLIEKFAETMTLVDSRFLREAYQKVMPNTELRKEFVCNQCDYEDDINFPFTVDFFWPQ
jgi:hypothetical protein